MRIELCNLLKQYFPSIKFNIILVYQRTIGSLFKHKDTLNKGMRSAVVYIHIYIHIYISIISVCWGFFRLVAIRKIYMEYVRL